MAHKLTLEDFVNELERLNAIIAALLKERQEWKSESVKRRS